MLKAISLVWIFSQRNLLKKICQCWTTNWFFFTVLFKEKNIPCIERINDQKVFFQFSIRFDDCLWLHFRNQYRRRLLQVLPKRKKKKNRKTNAIHSFNLDGICHSCTFHRRTREVQSPLSSYCNAHLLLYILYIRKYFNSYFLK